MQAAKSWNLRETVPETSSSGFSVLAGASASVTLRTGCVLLSNPVRRVTDALLSVGSQGGRLRPGLFNRTGRPSSTVLADPASADVAGLTWRLFGAAELVSK